MGKNVEGGEAIRNYSASTAPPKTPSLSSRRHRIFLLSPANVSGIRGRLIFNDFAKMELAKRLRSEGAILGEVFSFISGLYFRGKLTYARAYADPPAGISGTYVITAAGGLVSPDKVFTVDALRTIVTGDVDANNPRYRSPLERDARLVCDLMGSSCDPVLLGSVATPKYLEPLIGIFGDRLMFPAEFVGRGDMSRGGLLLRCAREQTELEYVTAAGAVRSGGRPPKLPKKKQFSLRHWRQD